MKTAEQWAHEAVHVEGKDAITYGKLIIMFRDAVQQARDAAFEEAAAICDTTTGKPYAKQIRALKDK